MGGNVNVDEEDNDDDGDSNAEVWQGDDHPENEEEEEDDDDVWEEDNFAIGGSRGCYDREMDNRPVVLFGTMYSDFLNSISSLCFLRRVALLPSSPVTSLRQRHEA